MWTEPSPSDFARWEERIFRGEEPSLAARELGFTCSRFKRADPVRQREALEAAREIQRGEDREFVRRKLRENVARAMPVDQDGNPVDRGYRGEIANRSLELLAKGAGEYDGANRVELTGAGGGPVVIEDRSASLADFLRVAQAVGVAPLDNGGVAGGEVPAARELLAAPGDG